MRFVALLFPRLGVQLARRANPELAGRPFGLVSGAGDGGLLSAVSVEATADGVEAGMTLPQARQRCPGIVVEPDNASACLATLEALVAILRTRATTNVAIVSRSAIILTMDGLNCQFSDEGAAAQGLVGLARSWSGLDVRCAVASSVHEAVCVARTARRYPVICAPDPAAVPHPLPSYEPAAVSFIWAHPATASAAEARLSRMLGTLASMVGPFEQSYREVRLEIEHGHYRRAMVFRAPAPIHTAAEAMELLRLRLDSTLLEGVTALRVVLDAPGPAVSVEPWRAPVAQLHQLSGPAVPIQRRLLRAS